MRRYPRLSDLAIRVRSLILWSILISGCVHSLAKDSLDSHFLDIRVEGRKYTFYYDVDYVTTVLPGRFTIISKGIDDGDVIQSKIKVNSELATFCSKPVGLYRPTELMFSLGAPDIDVRKVEVGISYNDRIDKGKQLKWVQWKLPYESVLSKNMIFRCSGYGTTIKEEIEIWRRLFVKENSYKFLFDCNRGLMGDFNNITDPPSDAIIGNISGGFVNDYSILCNKLGYTPYIPPK